MRSVSVHEAMQMALQHHQAGQLQEAAAIYRQVLGQAPNNLEALHLLGLVAHEMGQHHEAVELLSRAVRAYPWNPWFHKHLGDARRALGDLDEAIASYERAISLKNDDVEWHIALGNAQLEKGRLDEAIASFQRAVQLKPDYAEVYNNLAIALADKGLGDEAIETCKKAIELKADYADAFNNLGTIFEANGRLDEAIAAYRRAVELKDGYAEAHHNLGNALRAKGALDGAILEYGKAIEITSDFAEAHWNRSMVLLLMGNYAEGWAEYEWRWRYKDFTSPRRDFVPPRWDGTNPAGRTILLHAEQGFGDTLQFVRYAPLVARRGARVILECQPELRALFQSLEGVEQVVGRGEPLPPFEMHIPLMSLPHVFGTTVETVPAEVPYVKADPARVAAWRGRLGAQDGMRVGLVWAATPWNELLRKRSASLAGLAPIAKVMGVTFYSLQRGEAGKQAQAPPHGMRLIDLTEDIRDFGDTAALMAHLDLVISVDTAVAHLAGAMAKPVWTLLPFVPAWQWMLDREDSPWYPTMRLFRQPAARDWDSVVNRVARDLQEFTRVREG